MIRLDPVSSFPCLLFIIVVVYRNLPKITLSTRDINEGLL